MSRRHPLAQPSRAELDGGRQVVAARSPLTTRTRLDAAFAIGRQAVAVLEALPLDPEHGYSDDEVAAQYAATDRLAAAFLEVTELLEGSHRAGE